MSEARSLEEARAEVAKLKAKRDALAARMNADGMPPIVVRLTGDAAKDAAALEAANAKRAEVEIATGRAPGLIVFDP